ncbi:hypothetical protein LINPERHAP2_LOCUS27541 [Linum perenne]
MPRDDDDTFRLRILVNAAIWGRKMLFMFSETATLMSTFGATFFLKLICRASSQVLYMIGSSEN